MTGFERRSFGAGSYCSAKCAMPTSAIFKSNLLDIIFSILVSFGQVEGSRADVDVLVGLGQFTNVSFKMFPLVPIETDTNLIKYLFFECWAFLATFLC